MEYCFLYCVPTLAPRGEKDIRDQSDATEPVLCQHGKTFAVHRDGSCVENGELRQWTREFKEQRSPSVYPWWRDPKSITQDHCAGHEDQMTSQR